MKTSHPRRLLSLVFFLFLQATVALAQGKQVTISLRNATLKQVITAIEKQTPYNISYRSGLFDNKGDIDIDVRNASVKEVLTQALKSRNLDFEIISDKSIVIKEKQRRNPQHEGGQKDDGQKRKYTGLVTDESGEPIIGATLTCNGKALGVTDVDGRFNIKAYEGQKLTVTFIGMADETVKLSSSPSLNITLSEGRKNLQEVVVVGYGTQTKARVTGAINTLKADRIENMPVASFEQAIAGMMPGVQIQQRSGDPSGGSNIKVRASSSITAGTKPLIVVDGFPITTTNTTSFINPDDIESIEVLKDASSAAIYGSRGANGVIVITTKNGREGKTKVNAKAYMGFSEVGHRLDLMDAYEYAQFAATARNNYWVDLNPAKNKITDSNDVRKKKARIPENLFPYLEGQAGLTNTNWQDEVFRTAPMQQYDLSVSGGGKNASYYSSVSYLDQEGVITGSDFKRLSARLNLKTKINKRVSFTLNFSPSYSKANLVSSDNHKNDGISLLLGLANPTVPAYNEDGSIAMGKQVEMATQDGFAVIESPLALAKSIDDTYKQFRLLSNADINVKVIEGLNFKSHFGVEYANAREDYYRPSFLGGYSLKAPTMATGKYYQAETTNWINENTFNYSVDLGKHHIAALLGMSAQRETNRVASMGATNFASDEIHTLNAGIVNTGLTTESTWTLLSYFSRINYSFMDKYLLNFSVRWDGSSRFGKNNRYGSFPAASVGWRLSQEKFMKSLDFISDLKIRASYGKTGNFQINDYGAYSLLNVANYILDGDVANGMSPATSPNPNIGWEKSSQYDVGMDLSVWKNRLTLNLDYYRSTTDGMLLSVPVPGASGFTASLRNIGKLTSHGFEASLKGNFQFGELDWQSNLNYSSNSTTVKSLGPSQDQIISGVNITRVGGKVGSYYGYKVSGVFGSEEELAAYPHLSTAKVGTYKYVDTNDDKVIDDKDRVELGNYVPDFTMGFYNAFSWKGFDLSFMLQWVHGNKIFNQSKVFLLETSGWSNGLKDLYRNYWTEDRTNAKYARPNMLTADKYYESSDLMVEDGSFLRMTNLTLGYNFKSRFLRNLKISALRVYFTAQNLFTITDYSGYNPEVSSLNNALTPGIDYGTYPLNKSYAIGLNINF